MSSCSLSCFMISSGLFQRSCLVRSQRILHQQQQGQFSSLSGYFLYTYIYQRCCASKCVTPGLEQPPPISAASMWTRQDIIKFKEIVAASGSESVISINHGEIMTVRIPTLEDKSCIFWEFATDSYDLGFGIFFEWTEEPGQAVTIHISDSEDDEEEGVVVPEFELEDGEPLGDVERGSGGCVATLDEGPPISVIMPVYRRDCHLEVYVGNHGFPGRGAYLLKFDNSYSFWRSKTLYYRLYYK
ncbi:ACBD3 [Cordylochernes scorpioides]|uniref:ACBD3 n=1 Tax=Cordylochernes scorpioides TaxID=51811 RepID=A0ABY6K886_9ARAC|nr:ACBD3 [Cordylochernes scorpioides]